MPAEVIANRRPLKTRAAAWPHRVARALAQAGFSANAVSTLGLVFALVGAGALAATVGGAAPTTRLVWLLSAAVCIQLRLVCNLLDGLIAVENQRRSKIGELFNDVPDRAADVALLVAAGAASGHTLGPALGWIAAVAAVGTAYVRMLGASLTGAHDFCGPFAKPQRMAVLTVACVGGAAEALVAGTAICLQVAIGVIAVGTLVTVIRRLRRLARSLNAR